jgi:hypothetical protein
MGIEVFCRTSGNQHVRDFGLLGFPILTAEGSSKNRKKSCTQRSSKRRRQPSSRTHHKAETTKNP